MYETNYDGNENYESRRREHDFGSPKNVWYEDSVKGDECFSFSLFKHENTQIGIHYEEVKLTDRYEESSRYDIEHQYEETDRCRVTSKNIYYNEPSSCRGLNYEHFDSPSYNRECDKQEKERKVPKKIRQQNERYSECTVHSYFDYFLEMK